MDKGLLGDDDRKYIVTVLSTVLLTYVQRACRKDCLVVAESLIRKFPFLKDPVRPVYYCSHILITAVALLQYAWQNYIYVKCQNINRKPSRMNDKGAPVAKRPRYTSESELKACHPYPELEENEEDDVSHNRNVQQMKKGLQGAKPNHESLKELMLRTFGKRRSSIITDMKPVEQICSEYPLLQKANYVNVMLFLTLFYTGL